MARVLFVTPFYAPFVSGAANFVAAMARRLVADGQRVTVLTTNTRRATDFWQPPAASEPLLPAQEIIDGVEVVRLRVAYAWPTPYTFGLLRRAGHWLSRSRLPAARQRWVLRRLARSMPPLPDLPTALAHLALSADLIQGVDASWDGLFTEAAGAAHRASKPLLLVPLMHLGDAGVRAHFQMAHQMDVYCDAQAVLALSRREADAYAALGVRRERIHVVPMGVEPSLSVASDPARAAAFRHTLNLSDPVVAFLGAATYDKGAHTLALAVAHLNQAGQPVTLVCAGTEGAAFAAFLARQAPTVREALRDRVRILGPVDEETKHTLLAACDLLALPSQVDTFGIVLLEAWLHGKPVIGSDAGGIPDLVQAGVNGLLTPFGDAGALATAVRRLLEDPELAARLGAEGRRRTLARYTWDQTYQGLMDIYADCLHRPQIPA